jgi:hypothetical protein
MKLEIDQPADFKISACKFWNETGIEIKNGEEYTFEAIGFWWDLLKRCEADGYTSSYMRHYDKWKRSKSNNWFALMGSINRDEGFLIGKNNKIIFQNAGLLDCYANDVNGFYWNNFGKITLRVTRIK